MPTLLIELLGGFAAHRDDNTLPVYESDKTRGLLAYLAVERGKLHRRETLAGLFWPDMPEGRARANLNQTTYSLRSTLERPDAPSLLLSNRHTLELNPAFDLSSDVAAFEAALESCRQHSHDALSICDACRSTLTEGVALYNGPFLDGFSLPGCAEFEEWMALRREYLDRQAVEALRQLAACHEATNEIEAALATARRWAQLAPWQEAAHQRVMRLLALAGHRSEALAYGDMCLRMLGDEYGVEPRESTRWLVDDIRAGRIRSLQPASTLRPLTLASTSPPDNSSRRAFVGRGGQLAELNKRLEQALTDEGQIVFVAGEAGSGKTALLRQFAREAHRRQPDLLTMWGQGNAFAGSGDPYLPFRQVLGLLTGEAKRGYEMGLLDEAQAQRLWAALPMAVDALVTHSPDLIDAFMPGVDLLARVSAAVEGEPDWLAALRTRLETRKDQTALNRKQLHEQTLDFLRSLSARKPLLLLLDDLHWMDADSVSLLFHLARSLAGLRLLVVGAYRQEDIDIGLEGRPHPLKILLAECKRLLGLNPINLNRLAESERRDFTEQLIGTERNALDAGFRQTLFAHTEGHALFTVEALHECESRGIVRWQEKQGWVQQHPLDWGALPLRAEGVIEARMARLSPDLQELLIVASVEGEAFSAQTLAAALERRLSEVVGRLSNELDRGHRLVTETGTMTADGNQLDRFRFRHSLFRQHMYKGLAKTERQIWHGQVGAILERTYGTQNHLIAPQLALHFDLGGEPERALSYYLQSGDQARLLYADEQAMAAYERALALARYSGNDEQSARIHMRLGLTYHNALDYERAQASYAEGFRLWSRAYSGPEDHPLPANRPLRLIWGLTARNEEPTFDFFPDLFSGLVEETPALEIVPDIAHSWDVLDGGRSYVFHLRDDVRWSDGEPLTAHDFAFAWQHTRLPDLASGQPLYEVKGGHVLDFGITADLQRVALDIPDPYTLVLTLPQPTAYYLHLLAHPLAAPKPRHVVERYGNAWATAEHIVSNGPFILDRWDASSGIIHLVRNPTYHGLYNGNVNHVEALYFRQPLSWQDYLTLYESNQIDLLPILNWIRADFELARRRHLPEYVQNPLFTTFIYAFDTRRPPFHDRRVRQAFAMTFDREQGAARFGTQVSKPTYGGFIPPGMPGHSPAIALPYDPDGARRLLAESGYPKGIGFPEVELVQFYTPGADESCRFYVSQWRQVLGISMTYRLLEWTAYWRYLAQGSPHIMCMNGGGTYGDPDAFMRQSFRTVQVLTGWHHPDYERIIDEAGRSHDQAERIRLYQQADTLLMEEAPIFSVSYHDNAYLIKPWVRKMSLSPVAAGTIWKDVLLEAS
ncbi:MAG: AAA family ATPase [Halieaceae bacterium]|nr:AAA family ATPase [Halieaceae bacterium]